MAPPAVMAAVQLVQPGTAFSDTASLKLTSDVATPEPTPNVAPPDVIAAVQLVQLESANADTAPPETTPNTENLVAYAT